MNRTPIEWVKNPYWEWTSSDGKIHISGGDQGYTWNPITGCLNGCEYCYARKLANGRLKQRYLANTHLAPKYKDEPLNICIEDGKNPFYPREWFSRRERGLEGGKPKGVFVCDMSDLFGIGIPESWTECVLETIKVCPEHRFYLLTKQPQNLIKFSPFPPNCWVGVTITNREMAHNTFNHFQSVEAQVKFLSFEPLLDDVSQYLYFPNLIKSVNRAIIGAQTRPTVLPKEEWVEHIVVAADKAGIPVFIKHNMNSENLPQNAFNKEGLVRQEMPEGR